MRPALALATLILAGVSGQARAQDACPTPEPLPITVDGTATVTSSYIKVKNTGAAYRWFFVHVQLDRTVVLPSSQPTDHCGYPVQTAERAWPVTTFHDGARVRIAFSRSPDGNFMRRFNEVCLLDGSACMTAPATN